MKMKFYILSKLLSITTSILFSGYIAFSLSILCILFKGWFSIELCLYIFTIFVLIFIQHYIFFRVKFDADLLRYIAFQLNEEESENSNNLIKHTQSLDANLSYFNLLPKDKMERSWDLRFKGCLKLFKLQIILQILQYLALILLIFKLLTQ